MIEELLGTVLRTMTPILLAALGGLISERLGVFNIALEGKMLFGAFFSIYGTFLTGNPMIGTLFGVVVGGFIGFLFVTLVEKYKAEPIITAIGVNTLALGVTTFAMKETFGDLGSIQSNIKGFSKLDIPILRDIPFVNTVLNGHTPLTYISLILVVILSFIIYRTYIGINLRAVGEKPEAAEATGVSVIKYRTIGVCMTGVLCGLAGAHLALGYVTMFTEGMTAGRGFFAYAAVLFGKTDPFIVFVASGIFGFAESISLRAQQFGFPSSLVLMMPYIITILALSIRYKRVKKRTKNLLAR
ncbi:ABC transporter permease [Bacillus sp. S3]|uniref:ABC transporter permease n=1 Tax=Bacillus sp. S3 TaxID=486398 RepID=UPI001189DB32|nr:ABC transporter permease [Bacillus sp. S3]QCJ44685.1 ABC transporter permease [Bacillus sp. S3]